MKKQKMLPAPKKFVVTEGDLCWLRGSLMAKLRKDITWVDFYGYLGVSQRTANYIKTGQRGAGEKTFRGIMGLREYGIMVHMSDFDISQES